MHLDFFYNFSYYITYIILQHCSLSSHFSFVSCCLARTHHDIHILLISYLAYIFFNKRSCPVQVPTSKWVPAVGALYKTSVYYYALPKRPQQSQTKQTKLVQESCYLHLGEGTVFLSSYTVTGTVTREDIRGVNCWRALNIYKEQELVF